MVYVYRDRYEILHAVKSKEEAKKFAKNQIIAYDGEHSCGFPVIGGNKIFDYGYGNVYVGGNEKYGIPLGQCDEGVQKLIKKELDKIGI